MHELTLVMGLLEIFEDRAKKDRFVRIQRVVLEVGELSGVSIPALRFSFDVAMKGTVAEGAELDIREPPGTGWCFSCERTVFLRDPFRTCPDCGRSAVVPAGGTEFRIVEMMVV